MVDELALRSDGTSGSLVPNEVELEEKRFELAQRKAQIYAKSSLVPKEYRSNVGNVLIAQNMAKRMKADVLSVMQSLHIIHGRPGWSSQFLIACFNSCGRYSSIKYRFTGEKGKDSWGCIAYASEADGGEILEGTEVTIKMAKDEGWHGKSGSKWKTMPEQMLRYRAAAFFIRTVAPDIGLGMMTREELSDVHEAPQRTVSPIHELLERKSSNGDTIAEVDEVEGEAEDVTQEEPAEEPQSFDSQGFETLVMGLDTSEDIDKAINEWCDNHPEHEKEIVEIGVARRDIIEAKGE